MRIVVIGRTEIDRSQTVERLQMEGHEVVAALPRRVANLPVTAPRDPGHAGRPLRNLLERAGTVVRRLWLFGRRSARQVGSMHERQDTPPTGRGAKFP